MVTLLAASGALLILLAAPAQAEEALSCRGNITSKQGEGLVVRTFRFEVADVTGSDPNEVMEKCRKIVQQKQNRAGRANPAAGFRRFSDLDMECARGSEKFAVRRTLQTGP